MNSLLLLAGDVIPHNFNLKLVALSFFVSMTGSLVALDFAAHIRSASGKLNLWALATSGVALGGVAIWAMHFIGMTAHDMPFAVSFDALQTWLSLLAAIAASIAALALVFSADATQKAPIQRILGGGVFAGLGVAGMHYIGMNAWQTQATIVWDIPLVALSIAIAVVAASAALWLAFGRRSGAIKFGAAALMATAVCTMHYTGMYAGTIICTTTTQTVAGSFFEGRWLPYVVSIIAIVLLLIATVLTMLFSHEADSQALPSQPAVQ